MRFKKCAPRSTSVFAAAMVSLAGSGTAIAQPSASVSLAGVSFPQLSTNPPDQLRTSSPNTISAAPGYQYTFNPRVTVTFTFITIYNNMFLGDVMNDITPGMHRLTFGAMRNPPGTVPLQVYLDPFAGVVSGQSVSLSPSIAVINGNLAEAGIRSVTKPSLMGMTCNSGSVTLSTWTPPDPRWSEWHFEGDLLSVRQSGLAPSSGPARIRYLDDPAFGPILGGPGQLGIYPNPPTPTGITQAQSAFGTTSAFGIPDISGQDTPVYKTSPPRNLADPANGDKRRGIGLALWPNSREYWPDDKLSQWTMVMDIFIPVPAWSAEYPVALFDSNHNNGEAADAFIRQSGGAGSMGHAVQPGQYVSSSLIEPGRWMRVAISTDSYRLGVSRLFVDGSFIGTSGPGWLYAACKETEPRHGDISSTQALGTPVPPATWQAWGEFPSPWAIAPNATNPAPMGATACLFADLQGRGESFYIAALLFADEAMTDAQIAALGGVNPRGIVYLRPDVPPDCPADFNGVGGVTVQDIYDFLADWSSQVAGGPIILASADFNGLGGITVQDIYDFLGAWSAGCP